MGGAVQHARAPPTTRLPSFAGTAAVVSPIKLIHWNGADYEIPLNKAQPGAGAGPLAQRVWDSLRDIQYGRTPHEWSVKIA